jgi:hypothetical protein
MFLARLEEDHDLTFAEGGRRYPKYYSILKLIE